MGFIIVEPKYIQLSDREKFNVDNIATEIIEKDLGEKSQTELVNSLWENNETAWKAFFGFNKKYFITEIDLAKRRLKYPEEYTRSSVIPQDTKELRKLEEMSMQEIREINPEYWKWLSDTVYTQHMDNDGYYVSATESYKSKNKLDFQIDHIVSRHNGGLTNLENLQLLTRKENALAGTHGHIVEEPSNLGRNVDVEVDDKLVEITLTEAMIKTRMRLPRRMFGNRSSIYVNGHEVKQDINDQGRSTKTDPRLFGNVKAGQKLRFKCAKTKTSQRHYYAEVIGERKLASEYEKLPPPGFKTKTVKAFTKAEIHDERIEKNFKTKNNRLSYSNDISEHAKRIRGCKTFETLIQITGKIAVENEANGISNVNITNSGTFIATLGFDAREFLPTSQSRAFRHTCKELGVGLTQAVSRLNIEYKLIKNQL